MDYQERSDELEKEADELDERTDRLQDEIDETQGDWEAKKGDQSVPGAQPDDEGDGTDEDEGPEASEES